jgi:membrane protease YdiL (CAAX protease family)
MKGHPVIAWLVIVLAVGYVVAPEFVPAWRKEADPDDRMGLLLMKIQARSLVGANALARQVSGKADPRAYEQAKVLNTGPVDQRFRFIVLAGELAGPCEALDQLERLEKLLAEHHVKLTPTQNVVEKFLHRLYETYADVFLLSVASTASRALLPSVPGAMVIPSALNIFGQECAHSLSMDQRHLLQDYLGWFGDLALAGPGESTANERSEVLRPALRAVVVNLSLVIGLGGLALLGLFGLIAFLVFFFGGKLQHPLRVGSRHSGVYAESFAVYFLLFLGVSWLAAKLLGADWLGRWGAVEQSRLLVSGGAALVSLMALAWPVLRGIPWRQVRAEVGLTGGRGPLVELPLGLGAYAITLPLLAGGFLMTLGLIALRTRLTGGPGGESNFSPPEMPSHPVVQFLSGPGWWDKVQVLLLASVVAPLVEETMFRGVLYRHLREASAGIGFGVSILFSALLMSFIFAVIHPQGWVTIPALMSLSCGFALVREWRGTLLPGMVAHGLHNGLLLIASILLLAD